MQTVAVVGTITALMAAAIAFTQKDLKRIMAYSTVSQLGYMFLGLGVGAYVAAIFHLFTHAFFKALLFLGSGSVMHAVGGDVDITRQGKLFGRMRWTAITFIIGSLALSGFPLLSGFYSKEAILGAVYESGHTWLFAAGMLAAGGTAFYVFRAVFSVFFSQKEADVLSGEHAGDAHGDDSHGSHGGHGVHESPWSMLGPLVILAILSVIAGWGHVSFTEFLGRTLHVAGHGEGHGESHLVLYLSLAMVTGGIGMAWVVYQKGWIDPKKMADRLGPLYRLSYNKFYIDEIYHALIIAPVLALCRLSLTFDLGVIDGVVNLWGRIAKGGGESLAVLQSGRVRDYLLFMSLGVIAFLGVWLWL
jgi:NADH-quinone oxidoreductase subunit L